MDHYLTITEILSIVFENFYDTRQPKELAVLARTCRAFTGPALNILWREQLSLGPLIQCMPQDLWTLVTRSEGDASEPYFSDEPEQYLKFQRRLKTSDWDRFDIYASRIRRFGTSQFSIGDIEVDEGVFSTFRRYRPARAPLLPNLRPSTAFRRGLQHLRIVSLPSPRLPTAVAAHLSSLCSLTTLKTIRIPLSDVDIFATARFSALREFSMRPDTWSSATAILDSMPCTLKSLSTYCHDILTDEPVCASDIFGETLSFIRFIVDHRPSRF